MKFKGLIIEGKKEDYIKNLLEVSKFTRIELEKMSFNEVLIQWSFYFKPVLLTK